MKPTLLDTNTLSHLVRRQPLALRWAEQYILGHDVLQPSIITYDESSSGLLYKDARQQMDRFQALIRLHKVLPLAAESVNLSARIESDSRRRAKVSGPPIP